MEVTENSERPNNVERSEKQLEIDKMREALRSIACEMLKFQGSYEPSESSATVTTDSANASENEKILAELLKCKWKINSKRDRIQKLKRNLKTARFIAKSAAVAENNESGSLKQNLSLVRSECTDLLEKCKDNAQIINDLSRENKILRNKLTNVAKFIRLGYKELQKIRNEPSEEISILFQLKKLIICCGEYYANYCNEHETCLQIQQRNRFLENKILILESNVDALSEQVGSLEYRNFRLQKENDRSRDKTNQLTNGDVVVACCEVTMKTSLDSIDAASEVKCKREYDSPLNELDSGHDFDLSPHLSIVKKLLRDQDTLLKDLKMLSQECLISSVDNEFSS